MNRYWVGQQVLVVGPGWLGQAAATALSESGADVWTLSRTERSYDPDRAISLASARITALRGDVRLAADGAPWMDGLPQRLDHIMICIAPSRSLGDSHEDTYPQALRGALALARARDCRSIVYTSSTGVYGRTDGSVSHESDHITPKDSRQRALLDAELALRDPADDGTIARTILRVAGLYGPGRDPSSRLGREIPAEENDVWCNFSWRDDVVHAMTHCLHANAADPRAHLFNCADGTPLRASHIARTLGATVIADPMSSAARIGRTNQQVHIEALRATGWAPSMPTVFDGLRALGARI